MIQVFNCNNYLYQLGGELIMTIITMLLFLTVFIFQHSWSYTQIPLYKFSLQFEIVLVRD